MAETNNSAPEGGKKDNLHPMKLHPMKDVFAVLSNLKKELKLTMSPEEIEAKRQEREERLAEERKVAKEVAAKEQEAAKAEIDKALEMEVPEEMLASVSRSNQDAKFTPVNVVKNYTTADQVNEGIKAQAELLKAEVPEETPNTPIVVAGNINDNK